MFPARYELSPYVKQTLFVFKGLTFTTTAGKALFSQKYNKRDSNNTNKCVGIWDVGLKGSLGIPRLDRPALLCLCVTVLNLMNIIQQEGR